MIKNLFDTNQNDWNDHKGGYDPSKTLDNTQVQQMTKNLLAANGIAEDKDYTLKQITFDDNFPIETQLPIYFSGKDGSFDSKKPIILQVCNGSHWITMGLLPNPKNPEEYYVVKMDGKAKEVAFDEVQAQKTYDNDQEKINEAKKEYEDDQKKHQLDPEPVIKALKSLQGLNVKFMTADDGKAFNVSVEGQQYDNSCGLDTALNSVSIIKTYDELLKNNQLNQILNTSSFEKAFKKANDKNVFYQKKDDSKFCVLGKQTDFKEEEVLRILGTATLSGKCTNDDIEEALNAQLIKKLLLTDAINDAKKNVNFEGKSSEELKEALAKLEKGTLTDQEFKQALNGTGLLEAIAKKENPDESVEENKSYRKIIIEDLGKRHNIDRQL
jgi:hypothetical protein